MAREILFRAKKIDNGEWVEGNLFIDEKGEKHEILIGYVNYRVAWEVDKDTICQYTGLTDKNGNKIWENDVVYIPREDDYFKIEWQEDTAQFVMNGDSFIVTFDNYWSHEVEVYGSAFDIGELLGGEDNG
jgi:uncharacterized phage protein (TIGR01671 family)